MKKIMMFAAMMLMSIGAFAQNEVGQITLQPKVGMNLANWTNDTDNKFKFGMTAGVEAEYGLAENFGLTLGAMYSMEGAKGNVGAPKDVKVNLDYINIPIMIQYYIIPGLAVKAGVQPGFNVRHKASYDGESVDLKDAYGIKTKSVNLTIPVGLSYEYKDFVLDARYNIGTTKLFDGAKYKTSLFSLTLGYKFAL